MLCILAATGQLNYWALNRINIHCVCIAVYTKWRIAGGLVTKLLSKVRKSTFELLEHYSALYKMKKIDIKSEAWIIDYAF